MSTFIVADVIKLVHKEFIDEAAPHLKCGQKPAFTNMDYKVGYMLGCFACNDWLYLKRSIDSDPLDSYRKLKDLFEQWARNNTPIPPADYTPPQPSA